MARLMMCATALAFTLTSAGGALAATPEDKGLEIAKKVDKANEGFSGESSTMEMILINAQGDQVTRKMDSRIMERAGGDRSLITFKWPADVKNTRMLTWTYADKTDDQWLFLPALKRVKRITSRAKTGSFMGSEFSYEDLGSQEVEKYTYKFLREEDVDGRKHWVIERYPVDTKSGYSKQVTWIDQGYMGATKTVFYDRKGEQLKTMTLSDWQQFGKFWRANKIEVVNDQTRKRSILQWSNRELNKRFDEDNFSAEDLADL